MIEISRILFHSFDSRNEYMITSNRFKEKFDRPIKKGDEGKWKE